MLWQKLYSNSHLTPLYLGHACVHNGCYYAAADCTLASHTKIKKRNSLFKVNYTYLVVTRFLILNSLEQTQKIKPLLALRHIVKDADPILYSMP